MFSWITRCKGELLDALLQKYLPLLNTTFSSSFSESAIYTTLNSQLITLRDTQGKISGQAIPTYVYEINNKGINKTFVKYNSITEASSRRTSKKKLEVLLVCV